MESWTGIVLAAGVSAEEMRSRLPVFLHPIAGRPLLWHPASALCELAPRPERIVVLSDLPTLHEEIFEELPVPVELLTLDDPEQLARLETVPHDPAASGAVVVDGAAVVPPGSLQPLLETPVGRWVAAGAGLAAAAHLDWERLSQLFRLPEPLRAPSGLLAADARLEVPAGVVVRDRQALAHAVALVRDRVVRNLMLSGVTFLLPETVLVDVDVRIGRDSVIYPGAVIEGQTTIGDETVVGPECRIIDSWVGSGVELKGWNYVSHTSVRNRAILEPYARRGFD
ncbi:MAG TPA: hypothetical protein VFL93_08500 [Longimicrobiaceae bacterium]|nr:hypothetical protein [Longimicrobiaceae bacterium]